MSDSDEEEILGETPGERRRRLEKEAAEAKTARTYMWLDFALELASGDPLRVGEAMDLGVSEAFTLRTLQIRLQKKNARQQQ